MSSLLEKISFESHAERLMEVLTRDGVECFVTTTMSDIKWATGFTGSYGALIATEDSVELITDGRYIVEASRSVRAGDVTTFVIPMSLHETLARRLREKQVGVVSLDEAVSVGMLHLLQKELSETSILTVPSIIDKLRHVKDSAEIELIREMCLWADECFTEILSSVQVGETEQGIARRITDWIVGRGASNSFSPIVASGPNTAMPHAKPTMRELQRGDLVMIDFGVSMGGYGSDLTRTFVLGSTVEEWQAELWHAVAEAQAAAIEAVVPGAGCAEVDGIARDILRSHGYGDAFVHTLGHCLGGGSGKLSPTSSLRLAAGHVWTIEPGAYLPERGGVRIEDDVEVTSEGRIVMTSAPRFLHLD